MSWVHSMWIAGALAALARGHHAMIEGHDLSKSGYHLCTANETRTVSCVVFRVAPYIVQRHCGGWLPWRMCNVTLYKITYGTEYKKVTQEVTRCCHGFIRVGSYCALSLDRSREFTTKPGLCPAAGEEPPDTCETCVWDIDCSGWQKCCETVNGSRCVDPATNGGSSLNVTVTVKTDYHRMMASDKGLLNHTQLLLAMVNGALNSSEVSVKYLSSCPVGPYRTATSLIIGCNTTLSLDDTTADMHLLLRDVTEVSSVTVEDVDECAHPALRNCSPQAECNNTVASYRCTCRQGYTDVLPQNAGASCEGASATGPPSPPAPPTQDGPVENHTPVVVSSPDPNQPTAAPALSTTSENLSPSYTTYTSVTPPEESSTCAPPQLTQLSSSHITDTSFYLYWSSPSPSNQTSYLVVLRYGSEVISLWETNENTLNVTGLYPGVLYNVTVTPCACDAQGESLRVNVKTAAQTLAATARVTNINFTEDFLNSSSQAYLNFSTSFKEEIYKSLSPELMELVKSGKVRIEITSVSWGSVVVNFTIVSAQNYDTPSVSDAVLSSLLNSSNYYLDENSTRVFDFDECASGINDCSQYATCNNTWGSYTCVCNDGFEDMDPGWPGRVCGDTTSLTTPTTVPTATTSLTTPTTVPTATTSLTTPTTVPTATTSLTTPTTVPTATTSLTTPTTVDTATTSLTTPTAGVIVNLPTDMTNGKISVECGLTAIMVTVAKEFLLTNQISELSLHLGRESNRADVLNSTHVRLAVPWNDTDLLSVSNNTYYTAQVTLFNSVAPQANRTPGVARILKLPIICTYRKSILTSQHFGDIGYNMIIDPITVSGSFKVIMQLLNGTFPLPQNYTLSPDEDVVVRVTLNTSAEEVKLVISRCWATPTLNPVDIHSYIFLNSSCPLPHSYTSIISNGNASSSSLSVRIFSFVMLDVIYLHCQVQICVEMGSATCVPVRTFKSCVMCDLPIMYFTESLEEPLDMVHVVGFSVLGITMSLVFLGGLMCLFFYQRNRIGNYNFNIKPRQDNFTFHVFNT
ncbi:unnamed protein product [Merluccius merluccius]